MHTNIMADQKSMRAGQARIAASSHWSCGLIFHPVSNALQCVSVFVCANYLAIAADAAAADAGGGSEEKTYSRTVSRIYTTRQANRRWLTSDGEQL